jgi:hypothetical protein
MAETIASYTVPEHHVTMFTANVKASLVKMGGLIKPLVSQSTYMGEKAQVVMFIGPVEFIERDTPYSDTKLTELEHTQRWIFGKEYDCAVLVDRLDMLKLVYDPTSPYVERFREAANRKMDEIVVSAFFATAKTGKNAGTDTTLPAGNTVAAGGTGFTVNKLRSLRKLFKKKHVDVRTVKPYVLINAEGADDLLGETTVGSSDYNAVKPLVDGEVSSFMGFQFIPYEDNGSSKDGKGIPSYSSGGTIRQSAAWVPDGMHYGSWDDLVITINNRPDKNNIKQIHGTFTGGATRIDESKVFNLEWVE